MPIYAIITLVVIYNRFNTMKVTNSKTPFTCKSKILSAGSIHHIKGENVTLNVFHSDSTKCDYFVSIWADTPDAIMVNPWHPDKKTESFIPARYLNLYLKTKEQTKDFLAALNPTKIDLHLKNDDLKNEFLEIFNLAKNQGNRNFLIEHNEKGGVLDIKESYVSELV